MTARNLLLLKNLRLLDPAFDEPRDGYEILIEGERIKEVSDRPIASTAADVIDCGGRVVMPGLIDCHVHCMHSEVYMRRMEDVPLTLAAARGAKRLKEMLDRGFTTVRDTGGTDWGMKTAVDKGLIPGPRLFIAGRSIGPTGGHSDGRSRTNQVTPAPAATAWLICAWWPTAKPPCVRRCASRCGRVATM